MYAIIKYKKYGLMRFLSAIETSNAIERNIRRAHLPFTLTKGFHQKMKISYLDPMPTGVINLALYVRIELQQIIDKAMQKLRETSVNGLYPEKIWWTDLNPNRIVTGYEFKILVPQDCVDLSKYDPEMVLQVTEKSKSGLISDFFENIKFDFQGKFVVIRYLQRRDRLIRSRYLYEPILTRKDCLILVQCTEAFCNDRKLSELLEESAWAIEC
ncbi:TIGR03936 family radical SAM-associated protein [Thermotoga profunda]|uniref:TIGR03936 family radical SAM-associated protein n=1 Tax=Thermotoga profunda TaxID=1508420 RepID=UPI000596D757|nr:TIGR03936 family radical SAM-associated protein [Thermotoga profunda]